MNRLKKYLEKISGDLGFDVFIENDYSLAFSMYLHKGKISDLRASQTIKKNLEDDSISIESRYDKIIEDPKVNNLIVDLKKINNLDQFYQTLKDHNIFKLKTNCVISYKFYKILQKLKNDDIIDYVRVSDKMFGYIYKYKINYNKIPLYNRNINDWLYSFYYKVFDNNYIQGSYTHHIEFIDIENYILDLYQKLYNKTSNIKKYKEFVHDHFFI